MNIIEKYLRKIQEDYSNPVQTRPKPRVGITGEDNDIGEEDEFSTHGPAGLNVNLDINDSEDYTRINSQISKIK